MSEDSDLVEQKIKCVGCNKSLMNIMILPNKDYDIVHNIQALCPFCGDRSEVHTIKGEMYQGPIVREQSSYPTYIEDIETVDGRVIFKIGKAKNDD